MWLCGAAWVPYALAPANDLHSYCWRRRCCRRCRYCRCPPTPADAAKKAMDIAAGVLLLPQRHAPHWPKECSEQPKRGGGQRRMLCITPAPAHPAPPQLPRPHPHPTPSCRCLHLHQHELHRAGHRRQRQRGGAQLWLPLTPRHLATHLPTSRVQCSCWGSRATVGAGALAPCLARARAAPMYWGISPTW